MPMLGKAILVQTEIHNSRFRDAILASAHVADVRISDVDIDIAQTAGIEAQVLLQQVKYCRVHQNGIV
jgi:hypothetical protein